MSVIHSQLNTRIIVYMYIFFALYKDSGTSSNFKISIIGNSTLDRKL